MRKARATLAFRPADNQLYYLTYASGFRPGNVNSLVRRTRIEAGRVSP